MKEVVKVPVEDEIQSGRKYVVRSLKARADAKRSPMERFADWMTAFFGSITFLIVNVLWFAIWITINVGWWPDVEPFDPFPFGLLTMIVSLEAIILAIIVLISQNRAARIGDLREETDLQINTMTEEEVTKMIELQILLLKKNGVNVEDDPALERMLRPLRSAELQQRLEKQLNGDNKKPPNPINLNPFK
jgi:uncharacterized membrane protein